MGRRAGAAYPHAAILVDPSSVAAVDADAVDVDAVDVDVVEAAAGVSLTGCLRFVPSLTPKSFLLLETFIFPFIVPFYILHSLNLDHKLLL